MAVVLISGGTGLIGAKLTSHLLECGYEVIILSRNKKESVANARVTYSFWDIHKNIIDTALVQKADYVIHLAGAGVMDKKWTAEYKREIMDSRTRSSALLIKTLREHPHHVRSFVSASAIGWYGPDANPLVRKDGFIESDLPDKSFLGETCVYWESSVDAVIQLGVRLVKLRSGIVLSNDGGAFKEFKMPLNFGVAAILGDGKQIVSWIHIDDICRLFIEAMENKDVSGAYNAVAPLPVSNKKMILTMAEKFRNRFYIPIHVPIFLLKLLKGQRSVEILKSATVCDKKIKAAGFTFLYPTIEAAMSELAKK